MIKILFINTLYFPNIGGGAEIIFQEQVEGFKSRGYNVAVLTTNSGKGIKTDIVNDVRVYRAGIKNIYFHATANKPNKYVRMIWHLKDIYNREMRKYVKEVIEIEKPNVAICHNLCGFSIAVWDEIKAAGLPVIQVLHDLYLICPNSSMFKNENACGKQCRICQMARRNHPEKSQQVDAVVGVSSYVLSRLKENGYFKNLPSYVIHNAREIPKPPKYLVWNGEETLRLGFMGTLSKVKGVEWLITQFMNLDINATLTIAGRGNSIEYEEYLKDLAAHDKRISFRGYVKSADHYAGIHVSVVPSQWPDTFPGVAYESCAHHVPVITTRMGGLPEIIKEGMNGWFCDVNNLYSLGETILEIYNSPETVRIYSAQAREAVKEMLDVEGNLNRYGKMVKDIINKNNYVL
jgi:glycosyltransferase involved in cell wall biosynthesis